MKRFTHDQYVRAALSHPQLAKEFLHKHLPQDLQEKINWDTLEPQKTVSLDNQLKSRIADALFKVYLKDNSALYILIEHQSKPDEKMPLRMMEYTTRIIRYHSKAYPNEPMAPVYALIFYTGDQPYTAVTDFWEMLNDTFGFMKNLWDNNIPLVDLYNNTEDTGSWNHLFESALKHIQSGDIDALIDAIVAGGFYQEDENTREFMEQTIAYFSRKMSKEQFATLCDKIDSINDIGEPIMQSAAYAFWSEGREEGREEGRVEGHQEGHQAGRAEGVKDTSVAIARRLLAKGCSKTMILEATDLSESDWSALGSEQK